MKEKLKEFLEKYHIGGKSIKKENIVVVLMLGILLMVIYIPVGDRAPKEEEAEVSDNLEKVEENNSYNKEYVLDMENKLKTVLENVEGVGQVQVFITLWASKESILCKDSPYEQTTNVNTDNNGVREENSTYTNEVNTVLVEKDGNTEPIVLKEIEPEIKGVIVICNGGNNERVKMDILEAVEAVFGISSNKVKVMKMK